MPTEAKARIRINDLLARTGWRFFDDENGPANVTLETHVKVKRKALEDLGNDFEKTAHGFIDYLLLDERGFPIAVLEAKSEKFEPLIGKEQARKYARSQNVRFVILSNGNLHYFWDLEQGNPILITEFPTAESLGHFETDQGKGYLKALGNRAGPHALACELVGTSLAKLLGLLTLDFALIEIDEGDEIPLASGGIAQPGPAFITRLEKGTTWGGKLRELNKLANPKDIGRLVLFDTWTLNCDRYPADLRTRRPNRDNVFFSRAGAPRSQFLVKAIDHTHCFTCGDELNARLTQIGRVKDTMIYGVFPEFESFLNRREMARAINHLQGIRRTQIQQIVGEIPVEWLVPPAARDALVSFICDRADFLATDFIPRKWPQGELDI